MVEPDDNFVKQNNYNFAINEEFDYLDALSEELKKLKEMPEDISNDTATNKNGSEENESPKP
ncbi:MAG: hypothetical protein A2W93_12590 [Bacteroidetes bacterium GWF2_43_63]|nr:MAG: hypothetical protein A2W94_14710 [Bacteroidetes bacterium GWE2_42_42]OFY54199.1 MAG: hypothetical protein A2W93_12590 [Bacteroidetes bacterium GWF2_43_63]HBG69632.1 hypothetical protein [Bacteroidales bacterium]HCB61476.1 hypothetical protein [Bacteroidales bacterium]HCY22474.1 hypothetical protein [Bacteroidales bacterium]